MKTLFAATTIAVMAALPVTAATYDVSSNSALDTGGFTTGETLMAGQSFSVTVIDPNDTWILGATPREFTANGVEVSGANYGTLSFGGSTFNYGTLVGRIDGGNFFGIGLGGTFTADASGVLTLFNWDQPSSDNSGEITVDVSVPAVPLPAGGLMLLSAMALGGAAAARKRRKSA